MKVLFVCLGNICRSPLAEAIFRHRIQSRNWGHSIIADSCGTANYHIGGWPDHRTIRNATKNGVEIDHVGRQLSIRDLQEFDFVLAMDRSNLEDILELDYDNEFSDKVMLLRKFDPEPGDEVPDPYYGNEDDFQEVFEILSRSIDHFIDHLEQQRPS